MTMYGVYINCKKYPFIDWILDGRKFYETRNTNTLGRLVGKRVALVQTGLKEPVVRAMATIKFAKAVSYKEELARRLACIYGTEYDVRPNDYKFFYKLSDITPVIPYKVPENRVNHGRAYTEWEDKTE